MGVHGSDVVDMTEADVKLARSKTGQIYTAYMLQAVVSNRLLSIELRVDHISTMPLPNPQHRQRRQCERVGWV